MNGIGAPGWAQRLRSLRNGLSLNIASRLRMSRGVFCETACNELRGITPDQAWRIARLHEKYPVRFEASLSHETSLNNYAYLELLDRAFAQSGDDPPMGGVHADVGCASFWYAASLHAFFRPKVLTGYEIDAFRRYANAHTRQDYARGYAAALPDTHFRCADYLAVQDKVDQISCWFPFVSTTTILAWGLPLKLLNPRSLFSCISGNIRSGGGIVLVNHGLLEAEIAAGLCAAAGLQRQWHWLERDPLRPRPQPPAISYWRH